MINKLIIAFLLFLPIASATISTVSTSQNLYPGEQFNITIQNDSPPTLINITTNTPCITQSSLLMKKASQNLTIRINSSIPSGSYDCNFILSYNGTLTIVNPSTSFISHHTTTTIDEEITSTTSTSIISTSTIENVPSTTIMQTTTTIAPKTLKEQFTFWNLFRFIILPLVLLLAALRFAIYLKEKKVPGL